LLAAALGGAGYGYAANGDAARDNAVSFSASATEELVQDQMTVTLQAIKEGAVASDVQSALKAALDSALVEARKAVQANGKINGWQGSAQLVIEGTDTARISQLAGKLTQLNVVGVGYGLSRNLREARESALTTQAIARFRSRAQQMAHDFGFKSYTLGDVSVSSTDPGFEGRPVMYAMRAKAMDVADAPLPVEPGKGVLSVTVSGQVVLRP
jgi:predicted secreted protein